MLYRRYTSLVMTAVLVIITFTEAVMSQTETPKYKVVSSDENTEVRLYEPMIVAEVDIDGARRNASRSGFRVLADYIFGNNTIQQQVAMTTPVQSQRSQKIAMTSPVQQQADDDGWVISFIMPAQFTLQSLPTPNNELVRLREVPEQRFIVIRFSGMNDDENVSNHEQELREYIAEHDIETTGITKYAFYDPPWTPENRRRNEVMISMNWAGDQK